MNVVVNAEREDQATGEQNGEQGSAGEPEIRCEVMPTGWQYDRKSQEEREENGNAAESGEGTAVQVALQSWRSDPSVGGRLIAHEPGQNK